MKLNGNYDCRGQLSVNTILNFNLFLKQSYLKKSTGYEDNIYECVNEYGAFLELDSSYHHLLLFHGKEQCEHSTKLHIL